MSHWAEDYIGLAYQGGAQGSEHFDCWSLMVAVQRGVFGRPVSGVPHVGTLEALAGVFRDHPQRDQWQRVNEPVEGDGVLMGQSRHPIHVGIWVAISPAEQGVLHCIEGSGVVFQSIESLRVCAWKVEGFYRWCGSTGCIHDAPLPSR